jgi:hypothetical protein
MAKECVAPSTYRIRSEVAHDAYCAGNFVKTSSASFPKATWESVGGFDETLRVSEDYDFFMRLIARYDIVYIDEPLELSVFHCDNISGANLRRKFNPMFYTCHIRALLREYSASTSTLRRSRLKASICSCLLGLAYGFREAGDYRSSLRTYLKYCTWGGNLCLGLRGVAKVPVCCLRDLFAGGRALAQLRDTSTGT